MQSEESEPHSFIIKLWLGRQSNESGSVPQCWRGHITHVPGGERRYLNRLEEILEFIYLFFPEVPSPPRPGLWRSILAFWRKR